MAIKKTSVNFDVKLNEPIDIRYTIKTLSEQVDISVRYLGLIFYVEDIKKLYIYGDSITEPMLFSDYISRNNNYGEKLSDYTQLNIILNGENETDKIGKMFTIFPLNVTFIFDGENYVYYSGTYDIKSEAEFETIPIKFRGDKALVRITNDTNEISYKVILSDGKLSDEIIELGDDDSNLINHRFYSKYGNLYYCISGTLFFVGSRESIILNFDVKNGINKVTHNLNSENLCISLVSEQLNSISSVTFYKPIDKNTIEFESYCDIDKVTLIIKTI